MDAGGAVVIQFQLEVSVERFDWCQKKFLTAGTGRNLGMGGIEPIKFFPPDALRGES